MSNGCWSPLGPVDGERRELGWCGGCPQSSSIPFQSACRDQMASGRWRWSPGQCQELGSSIPVVSWGKWAPGIQQVPNKVVRAQERSCHTHWPWGAPCKPLLPARLRVCHKPCQNPTEPQNNPAVLTQCLSEQAKRTQQTPVTPSHCCHLTNSLACSSQQPPCQTPGLWREGAML